MLGFFKGVFQAGGDPRRDSIVDQLVTLAWATLLMGQEWWRWREGMNGMPLPVTGMAATAMGYAAWRLWLLVPLYRRSA
mgnify:FL=1